MSNRQDGGFRIGETWGFVGTVRDNHGRIQPIGGATIRLRLRAADGDELTLTTPDDGEITSPAGGSYRFDVTPQQQTDARFTVEKLQYEVKVDFADGRVSIQNVGTVLIHPSLFQP